MGKHVLIHKFLSQEDLIVIYRSKSTSRNSPFRFRTKLTFTIDIFTGMCPLALASIIGNQFWKTTIK